MKGLALLILIALVVFVYTQQPIALTIKAPANEPIIIELHAITTEKSKIHVVTDCKAEVHDTYGNVITELPANFNGTIHLHLNCSKSSSFSVWPDHGIVWME